MVYGHFIQDTAGNERFFVEGCSYCRMSTGGKHELGCPYKDMEVSDRDTRLKKIREDSFRRYGEAWQNLSQI